MPLPDRLVKNGPECGLILIESYSEHGDPIPSSLTPLSGSVEIDISVGV